MGIDGRRDHDRPAVNLMPGPVPIHGSVREVFAHEAVSHRGTRFLEDLARIKRHLCGVVNAGRVEVLLGSGTLSNDAVAAQLSLTGKRGLILRAGEFGERLVNHARRMRLDLEELAAEWGCDLDYQAVDRRLGESPAIRWIWSVHCETSTGVLHDLERLKAIAEAHGVRLVLDCISSIGTVPVDLDGVFLATCVSGKALASFPGLSMVFHHHEIQPDERIPRYLDLGGYASAGGVAFTQSSNLVYALGQSLERLRDSAGSNAESNGDSKGGSPFATTRTLAAWLRGEMRKRGYAILAEDPIASPAVITWEPSNGAKALELGDRLAERGFLLSYNSGYLVKRNLIQICLMGEHSREPLERLLRELDDLAA